MRMYLGSGGHLEIETAFQEGSAPNEYQDLSSRNRFDFDAALTSDEANDFSLDCL